MSTQQAALENLRVIRSLMEKAHIYRAISVKAALEGGVFAILAAVAGWITIEGYKAGVNDENFLAVWLGIFAFTSALNVFYLFRDAKRRGQKFVSEGMRLAIRAFLPPMTVGGVVGIGLIVYLENHTLATLIWVLSYGLALLSTASFSPRSLVRLGWMFVIGGLILFWLWAANPDIRLLPDDTAPASLIMGLTFGLLHIGYGIAVLFSKKPEPLPAE